MLRRALVGEAVELLLDGAAASTAVCTSAGGEVSVVSFAPVAGILDDDRLFIVTCLCSSRERRGG